MTEIHIIDDDEAVRDSIHLLLKSVGLPSREYANAQDFLDGCDAKQPGCVVLDVRMPGMSGLELQQEMNRRGWQLPIIFISGHGDVPMAVEAMRHGAVSFLQKPFRDEELLSHIREATAISDSDYNRQEQLQGINRCIATLTEREREIANRIVTGQANKVMAIELGISLRTVEVHRARVMEKMSVHSVAELVQAMIKTGSTDN